MPWGGCLVDRYDGRTLLDAVPPPPRPPRPTTEAERELDEMLVFESFRDAIELLAQGLSQAAGLVAAERKNIELRARAREMAAAALGVQQQKRPPGGLVEVTTHMPAGACVVR